MVNRYLSRLTLLQKGILRLLFIKTGLSLNQRQIASFLEVTSPAVMKALPFLEEKEFIKMKQDNC